MDTKEAIKKKIAKVYMQETVRSLKQDFPILSQGISLLKFREIEESKCNNKKLMFYDGEYVNYYYKDVIRNWEWGNKEKIKRNILHIVFHGILGHFTMYGEYESKKLVDATMDRIVEHMVGKIMPETYISDVEEEMNQYLKDAFDMSCYYKGKRRPYIGKKMISLGKYLKVDDHSKWPRDKENTMRNNSFDAMSEKWNKVGKAICGILNVGDIQQKDFANKLIKTLNEGNTYGNFSGNVEEVIKADKGEGESYREIILKHLTTKSKDREEPDTIDNMMYQYGLELYGDVPLIEPVDDKEIVSLHTICIALDVSGSCEDKVASLFLRETKNMLQDLKRLSSGGEVYYCECDTMLQREEFYESIEDISCEAWECREMRGFGGTSFVPVFERVDKLIKEGKEIDCLIYLTDGWGEYPKKKPDYPVYFILPTGLCGENKTIPKWINSIKLKE